MSSAERLYGLAPLLSTRTRLLILGSFPGRASLAAQQYYAHPRNQFWLILAELWRLPLPQMDYPQRCQALLDHGLGLWDVYASCERSGSLDADIRCAQLNDWQVVLRQCPELKGIAHNGGESYRHARQSAVLGVPVLRLPSTSPANASWSYECKLQAWRGAFEACGVKQ